MASALFTLLQNYLKKEKIQIDASELKFQLESHPSYPSLHALTGVLDHFNIDNLAIEVDVNTDTLKELPNNFMAVIKLNNQKEFATVSKKNTLYIVQSTSKKEKYIPEKFLNIFTGIVLVAEATNQTEQTKKQHNYLIVLLAVSTVIATILINQFSLTNLAYVLLSIIGLWISIAITQQEFGLQTSLGDTICGGNTEKKDCDAVISSTGATLPGNIKLSDMSLIYFGGLLLSTIMLLFNNQGIQLLYLVSFVASLITFYSIYYQAFVVKKWCMLCLSIVSVLWLQLFVSITSLTTINIKFTTSTIIIISLSFALVASMWYYLKLKIQNYLNLTQEKINFHKFKHNFSLFVSLLEKGDSYSAPITKTKELVFGNTESPLQVTIVTNPFCGHCRPTHTLVENILNRYHNLVNITIKFNISIDNPKSDVVLITSRILELYHTKSKEIALQAMHDIYSGMSPEKWFNKWDIAINIQPYLNILIQGKDWCKQNNINFTPEIIVNNYAYPNAYKRADLLQFIEDLHEEQLEKQQTRIEFVTK